MSIELFTATTLTAPATDSNKAPRLEVVDGQQRLTTISLLLAALYMWLHNHKGKLNDNQIFVLMNLKFKLILQEDNAQLRVIPQTQNNNQDDYRAVLSHAGVIDTCDVPANAGNRRIFKAFRYFQSRIGNMFREEGNQLESIIGLLDKVSQSCLVKIEVASHADAYTLFESLNNRGEPLTPIDLIKNKLLARLETTEPGRVDHYFDVWNKLLGYLGDDYTVQERFFRHYYNAFKDSLNEPFRKDEDKKTDTLGPVATRSNLIHIYEKLINQNAQHHLQAIRAAGQLYALMLARNSEEAWVLLEKPLKDLDRIQGSPSYLLMLYLLVRSEDLVIKVEQLKEIVQMLVCFFVRRNLTDTPPTRDLTRLFMTIIANINTLTENAVTAPSVDKINNFSGNEIVETVRNELDAKSANDEIFRNKLAGAIFKDNYGVTRFILCSLAEQGMTRETWVDLWKYEGQQLIWTIEHIFPQGENIPDAWVKMIAAGNQEKAKEYQIKYVHSIGNLTISGFNSSLGNKSFIDKRDRLDSQERQVGYKNGLQLNADLVNVDSWSVEQISARTSALVERAVGIFGIKSKS